MPGNGGARPSPGDRQDAEREVLAGFARLHQVTARRLLTLYLPTANGRPGIRQML
jgi:hypothetical protein